MFNVKQAITVLGELDRIVGKVQGFPQLTPLARDIVAPLLNGHEQWRERKTPKARKVRRVRAAAPPAPPEQKVRRRLSATQKKQLSLAMKARWRAAKKAGVTKLGGTA